MIKRVYFGNWLRDYSQALDVGTLRGVQADTIRILVWVLSFLSFGYATGEFEVTEERLGVYRPEEHIDNPRDYADNADARRYDPRLRPPVTPAELAIDPQTGMKNYIANESGFWATSSGYIKYSFARSIHFGRLYTSGAGDTRGREADLSEALRCLGQGLHCVEDFSAHSNYVELALRELGYSQVFPHTGTATELDVRGKRVFPLITGTFGAVDFLHSVLGEATDHFTQSEINVMDKALIDAQKLTKNPSSGGKADAGSGSNGVATLLSQIPGVGSVLSAEATALRDVSDAHERANASRGGPYESDHHEAHRSRARPMPTADFAAPPGSVGGPPAPGIPGMSASFDPVKTAAQIYPILEFRDKVVKAISATIEKIPGLQALCERISETITVFVLSLLAPFIRPIINAVAKQLQEGSSAVVDSAGRHQFEPWTDPYCTDPTHSLLSKDHFTNILNEVAGQVAAVVVKYVGPRIIYAWSHPGVPVQQVTDDIVRVLHHPAVRDPRLELHRDMFERVRKWAESQPGRGSSLNSALGSESVKRGGNLRESGHGHDHGHDHGHGHGHGHHGAQDDGGGHGTMQDSEWGRLASKLGLGGGGGGGGARYRDTDDPPDPRDESPPSESHEHSQHHLSSSQDYGQHSRDPYAPTPSAEYGYHGQDPYAPTASAEYGYRSQEPSAMAYQQQRQPGYPGALEYAAPTQPSSDLTYYSAAPPGAGTESRYSSYAGGDYGPDGGYVGGGGYAEAGPPPSRYQDQDYSWDHQQQQYPGYEYQQPPPPPDGGDPGYRY